MRIRMSRWICRSGLNARASKAVTVSKILEATKIQAQAVIPIVKAPEKELNMTGC